MSHCRAHDLRHHPQPARETTMETTLNLFVILLFVTAVRMFMN